MRRGRWLQFEALLIGAGLIAGMIQAVVSSIR